MLLSLSGKSIAISFLGGFCLFVSARAGKSEVSVTDCPIAFESRRFVTREGSIEVDEYSPKATQIKGLIVIVHGSAGLLSERPTSASFDNLGEHRLACAGFRVFIPHYFDISGIGSASSVAYMEENSEKWVNAVRDSVTDLHREYRPLPLFLYGYSLGGFIALTVAGTTKEVAGLSILSAGLRPDGDINGLVLPPTLIQHGAKDTLVPVKQARELDLQIPADVKHELVIYPEYGHNIYFESYGLVTEKTAAFFSTLSEEIRSKKRRQLIRP